MRALAQNTEALRELKAEVSRLADTFGKVVNAEPARASGEDLLANALVTGLGMLGKGRKKR